MNKPAARVPYHMRPQINRPSVLILKEKHENCYFYVPDDETLFKAALEIVAARNACGHYYHKPDKPKDPGITKEQVESLPEVMKPEGKKKLAAYNQKYRWYRECADTYETVQKALTEKDGRAAWDILRNRSDGEYEGVSLEAAMQPGDYKQ